METILTNQDKTVTIGPDKPFVIIGERINPTRRKKLAATMSEGDFSMVQADARRQVAAGAQVLDVNAGIPGADEPALLKEATLAVLEVTDAPLCFDSANPEALAAALSIYPGKALINSTTAEEKMMERVFPLDRLKTAEKLVRRAADFGIPAEDIIIDCLALTVGADHNAGRITLDALQLIRAEIGVNLSLGASNVSFGLPDRKIINVAYLALAIARGLTAAITDPTVPEIRNALLACDLLMGHDEYAMNWIRAYRQRVKETEKAG